MSSPILSLLEADQDVQNFATGTLMLMFASVKMWYKLWPGALFG